jgi:hypothetical protein
MACRDIQEDQLVRSLRVVAGGHIDRIARVSEVHEIRAFHDTTVIDIQARDDPLREHLHSRDDELDRADNRPRRPIISPEPVGLALAVRSVFYNSPLDDPRCWRESPIGRLGCRSWSSAILWTGPILGSWVIERSRGSANIVRLHVLILSTVLAVQPDPPFSDDERGTVAAPSPSSVADPKSTQGADSGPQTQKETKAEAKKPDVATKESIAPNKNSTPGAKSPTPKSARGPRVLTKGEMQKPRSPFLDPPGSEAVAADRYGPGAPEWSEIPPWRQTSFFGIRAQGRFFVYVIDSSESMIEEDRFARATMEVRRSVLALQAPQQFEVIFYNEGSMPMPGGPQPRPADTQNKSQLVAWLRMVDPDGGTDPRSALRQALSLRPEAVFLLSDGEFPKGTAEIVAGINPQRIPIHCVDLSGGEGGDHLRRIARESGGQYASRPGSLQGKR